MEEKKNGKSLAMNILVKSVLFPVLILALTFLLAGRLDYIQGWIYNLLNAVILAATIIVMSGNKELINERLKPGEGIKWWDRLYFIITTPLYFAAIIVACLDAGRFLWTGELPVIAYISGIVLYVLSQSVFLWAKYVNKFLSSVVRIQTDRGHEVCDRGPYRFLRHPSYIAGIIFGMCTPFILGSLWALIPQGIAAAGLIIRTYLEDETLKKELPGYAEYAGRVKYRLIPFIW